MVRNALPRLGLVGAFLALTALPVRGQVSVAPTAVFLTPQEPFGAIYIANQAAVPQEVTVGFRFGYPAADSAGTVFVQYEDSSLADIHSLAPHVRAFPQRFVLPPGESQVVRLTARPPGEANDRWMWTRVITTSTPQVEFQDTTAAEGVSTRVVFRLQQITALFFRAGEPSISVDLANLTAEVDSNAVVVEADFNKSGEGPFLGLVTMRLKDSSGQLIVEQSTQVAVYVPERRRFVVTVPPDYSGSMSGLQTELVLTSERRDIPRQYLTELNPVVVTANVEN